MQNFSRAASSVDVVIVAVALEETMARFSIRDVAHSSARRISQTVWRLSRGYSHTVILSLDSIIRGRTCFLLPFSGAEFRPE